jgi:putative ABC transport system substrate-binding protein
VIFFHLPGVVLGTGKPMPGGLLSCGVNLDWCFNREAYYVGKILKGTKPADLPVEFPTSLELWINLKTAKALGLKIPSTLLVQADKIIE